MKRPMNKHPEAKRIAAKSPQIPGIGSPKHSYFVINLNLMNILSFFKEKMNDVFQIREGKVKKKKKKVGYISFSHDIPDMDG